MKKWGASFMASPPVTVQPAMTRCRNFWLDLVGLGWIQFDRI